MGSGTWTKRSFTNYSAAKGMCVDAAGSIIGDYHVQEMFKQRWIAPELNIKNVIRECCDSEEHPNTIPVILGIDVTGSMGSAAMKVAKELNPIMETLFNKVADVEFLIMGIGDLAYDEAPIQASQFESDIRIAEQLDKIYFEAGGGGNSYESYTAAWYFGLNHCRLDCWKRGKKGIIITMGDEPLNPYLPIRGMCCGLADVTGDNLQADVNTKDLYEDVIKKYDVYHLAVDDMATSYWLYAERIEKSFGEYLDKEHLRVVNLNTIANTIVDIVCNSDKDVSSNARLNNENGMISW